MFSDLHSSGCSVVKSCIRSISAAIRSTSLHISWVRAAERSSTLASRSCAAPLIPDSGFLISCARIAAAPMAERVPPVARRCAIC